MTGQQHEKENQQGNQAAAKIRQQQMSTRAKLILQNINFVEETLTYKSDDHFKRPRLSRIIVYHKQHMAMQACQGQRIVIECRIQKAIDSTKISIMVTLDGQ